MTSSPMHRIQTLLVPGALYFVFVFAAGFALGTLRTLWLAPAVGETMAVAIELPIMLAISWKACTRIVLRRSVAGEWVPRLAMGLVGFALLMGAELGLSVLAFGRTVTEHCATYGTSPGLLGLAGQFAFAGIPIVQRWKRTAPDRN